MIDIKDKKECCGCGACEQRCPKQCISMQADEEGFLYPQADAALCIDCGLCEKVCPVINRAAARRPMAVYAARNPNRNVRAASSSGGIFTLLAESVLAAGGVVFGAKFDERWGVEHDYTETPDGLAAFRGSKYLQSRTGRTFKQAERFLRQGRTVLYSGTPCQIAGLRRYLRKDYANLVAVEVVCHGVPSPLVWKRWLKETVEKAGGTVAEVARVNFRDKCSGWKNYSLSIYARGHSAPLCRELSAENSYMRGFLADLFLRPACYACPSRDFSSGSDITLGDFWGIGTLLPDLDDDGGVSVVTANTGRGREWVRAMAAAWQETTYEVLVARQPSICHSAPEPPRRATFFRKMHSPVSACIEAALKPPFWRRAAGKARRILSGLGRRAGVKLNR